MNAIIKMWSVMGGLDVLITVFTYQMLVGSWMVYLSIFPTIMLLGIGLPIQRIVNHINTTIKKQDGKCYNCNLMITDKNNATLEDNPNRVYCKDCHRKLYGHLYEQRNGIWYKKDE